MDSIFGWSHSQYSEATLLIVAVAYSALVWLFGMFLNRVARLRNPALWLLFGVASWLPLLIGAGQHIPLLDAFAPSAYCFGEPGFIHVVALAMPPLAVTLAAGKVLQVWRGGGARSLTTR